MQIFSRLQLKAKRWFVLISQAAFGVFVIHKNIVINDCFVYNKSNSFAAMSASHEYSRAAEPPVR